MERKRIENAVDIINYAINNNTSIKSACIKCGFGDTYVKNTKRELFYNYQMKIASDEDYNYFMNVFEKYSKNKINSENNVNVNNNQENNRKGEQLKFDVKDENEGELTWISGSNYPKDHIKTLDQLLTACNVDLNKWKVSDYTVNKWDVTSWKKDDPQTVQNFQVKARLNRIVETIHMDNVVETFKNMVKNYVPPVLNLEKNNNIKYNSEENNLLEICIFDLHLGKLGWGKETGESYDSKIASDRFFYAINTLLKRAQGFSYNRIVFPIGNDFFNSDNLFGTTTMGTQQFDDSRWQKMFDTGVKLIVDGINILKQMNVPIDVLIIPGNHDYQKSFYMGSFLNAWFNNDDQVNINNNPSPRKYYKFGKVLIGYTHGSEEKTDSLPLLMASDIESKKHWSETLYHEWHLGHEHRKKQIKYTVLDKAKSLKEDLGVTVRCLSSLTGTEEWHHRKGYVGQIKAADGFIWNDNLGMLAHLNSNIVI